MAHGSPTLAGNAEIEEFWAGDFEDRDALTLLRVTHSVRGTDMVLVHGDYEVVSRSNGGKLGGGRFAHIWTADGSGGWRLDRDLWFEQSEPVR